MLRSDELGQNHISITFRDEAEATRTVLVERLKQGLVRMTCECPRYSKAGWCQHCLAVFSDRGFLNDEKHRQAFERIARGTSLEDATNELTKALDVFVIAYRQMKFDRPVDLDTGQLKNFANRASQASSAAADLSLALEDFINELQLRPSRRTVRAYLNDPYLIVAGEINEQRDAGHPPLSHLHGTSQMQNSFLPERGEPAALTNSPKRQTASGSNASISEDRELALEMVRKALERS